MTMFNFRGKTYKSIQEDRYWHGNVSDAFTYGSLVIRAIPLPTSMSDDGIRKVVHNEPATIVIWEDGTKTVVKCSPNDQYDREKGLLMCIAKKMYGSKAVDILRKWCR